jgi:hypothetical protein
MSTPTNVPALGAQVRFPDGQARTVAAAVMSVERGADLRGDQ